MGKIISLTGYGECPDKAVVGFNTAVSIASQNKSGIAFLDLSARGDKLIELLTGFKPEKSIIECLTLIQSLDKNFIKGYLPVHPSGISMLGGIMPGRMDSLNPEKIKVLLNLVSSVFPFTLVVLPETPGAILASILEVSNLVIINSVPNTISLSQVKIFSDNLKSWHFPLSLLRLVVHSADTKYDLDRKKIEEYAGIEIISVIKSDNETVNHSVNTGSPAVLQSPHGTFSIGMKELSAKLLDESIYGNLDKQALSENTAGSGSLDGALNYSGLKEEIHDALISELKQKNIDLNNSYENTNAVEVRDITRKALQGIVANKDVNLNREERERLVDELLDEALGLGCLEKLLKDPGITEIMVNGPREIYVEKSGKIYPAASGFTSNRQLMIIIDRIVSPIGRRIDESSPLVDARLSDGSRVNIIIPPLSLGGPSITIRKFSNKKLAIEDLVNFGALKQPIAEFLKLCVQLRKNIVVSGGTGSGKTTLLNIISSFIPENERIITIEDSAELRLPQKHVVRLESKPPSIEGTGAISIRRLVINALRMRPDRIVVGECRGGEALDMLQAMNTGHDGSLTTVHANSPKDSISRITTMVIMAGTELPEKAIREQIASAVNIIVQLARVSDGTRKITEIAEACGIKNGEIELVPIFKYEQTSVQNGQVAGRFIATGNVPSFLGEAETHGLNIDKSIFARGEIK